MSDKPSVVEALSAVMGDVQAVGKTEKNQAQGWSFRGIDNVVNAVGPALRKHGVVCLPRVIWKEFGVFATKGGTTMHTATVEMEYTFVGPAGDTLTCSALGEAADASDKCTAQAQSVAFRVALLQALCIPTHETDPDSRTFVRAELPQRMSASQQTELADLLAQLSEQQAFDLKEWWRDNDLPPKGRLSADQCDLVLAHLRPLVKVEAPA